MAEALQIVNSNLITPKQTEYVMNILAVVMECQRPVPDKLVKFSLFAVIAALSERIVSLDSTVTHCLNKMDFTALRAKLIKARDMFIMCDTQNKVWRDFGVFLSACNVCSLSNVLWITRGHVSFVAHNNAILQGIITLEALRIELKAGRISKEHEDEAIKQLEHENKTELSFLDFLVCLRFSSGTRCTFH